MDDRNYATPTFALRIPVSPDGTAGESTLMNGFLYHVRGAANDGILCDAIRCRT